KGLALLARKGYAVVPGFAHRCGDLHQVTIGKPLPVARTDDEERDIVENTALFTKTIEDHIRQHPEEWLWFHRRWKTRPL
ncbi:MAG: lipid A biosynthesis acyltransferase, partial [Nitrospirota bacterium]|nr:lipid A biosynthesis acyltransferase [Nitrospirota bacterium]